MVLPKSVGGLVGCTCEAISAAAVVFVWEHRRSRASWAIVVGALLRPRRTRTPCSASRYGMLKSTLAARSGVIVTSASAMSQGFGPGPSRRSKRGSW